MSRRKLPTVTKRSGVKLKKGKSEIDELNDLLLGQLRERRDRVRKRKSRQREIEDRELVELNELLFTQLKRKKKGGVNKSLQRRNRISKILKSHLDRNRIDLLTYTITNVTTGEVVFLEGGDKSSASARYNLVLGNIVNSSKDLDLSLIASSFTTIFSEDSGLVKKQKRNFDDHIYFFDYRDVFSRPTYDGVIIKITVSIPFTDRPGVYTGLDDPKLFDGAGKSNESHLFTASELTDWFGTSNAYKYARDWDRENSSPIVEFGLEPGFNDQFVHYHLTVYSDFFERVEEKVDKKQAPTSARDKQDEFSNIEMKIKELQAALPFLEGEERSVVLNTIEDFTIDMVSLQRDQKEQKKPEKELELERMRFDLEREKIKLEEERLKLEADKLKVIQDMVSKGFTYEQIKDILG